MNEKSIPLQTNPSSSSATNERNTAGAAASRSSGGTASLQVVEPRMLYDHMNETFAAITRRAFELFERDGGMAGRDMDHWIRAEAEFLHPVHVRVSENGDALNVRAEVPGFEPSELQVSLEPRRLTISGKKQSSQENKGNKNEQTVYQEQCCSEILRMVELPMDVDASKAAATLKNGILELTLPKTAETKSTQVKVKAAGGNASD